MWSAGTLLRNNGMERVEQREAGYQSDEEEKGEEEEEEETEDLQLLGNNSHGTAPENTS